MVIKFFRYDVACVCQRFLKNTEGKIFGQKTEQRLLLLKAADDIVCDKENFTVKIMDIGRIKRFMRLIKELAGFKGDQLVSEIIFILKIQVKGSLGQTGLLNDIRNGRLGEPFSRKQVKGTL